MNNKLHEMTLTEQGEGGAD